MSLENFFSSTSIVTTSWAGQIFLLGLTVACFLILWEPKRWKRLKNIPGPPKMPLFGSSLALNVPNHRLLVILGEWISTYGKRVFISIGMSPRIILTDSNDLDKVLGSHVHINKDEGYLCLMPWLGFGLVTSNGEMWVQRRKLLTPAFHFKILEKFLHVFNEQSLILMRILETEFGDGKVFDISPYTARCTLDMIFETAMGSKLNAQSVRDSDYLKAIHRVNDLIIHRIIRPWLHPNFLWQLSPSGREEKACLRVLHELPEKIIRERKLEFSQRMEERGVAANASDDVDPFTKGKEKLAFLDLLIEAQAKEIANGDTLPTLTDLSIREETDTFLFGGHDTTSANINWVIFLIATYPDIQRKVQAELDEIFGESQDRPITSDDLTRMKYLECCIKETMRIYPSIPWIGRKLNAEVALDGHVTLPNGSIIYVFPFFVHRDPIVFPNPETFSPDRFLPENANGRHPYAYIPFSAGPRNCIGQKFAMMEVKVVLANFFRNFNVVAMQKREDLLLCMEIILRSKNGISIKLTPRKRGF